MVRPGRFTCASVFLLFVGFGPTPVVMQTNNNFILESLFPFVDVIALNPRRPSNISDRLSRGRQKDDPGTAIEPTLMVALRCQDSRVRRSWGFRLKDNQGDKFVGGCLHTLQERIPHRFLSAVVLPIGSKRNVSIRSMFWSTSPTFTWAVPKMPLLVAVSWESG